MLLQVKTIKTKRAERPFFSWYSADYFLYLYYMSKIEFVFFQDEWNEKKSRDGRTGEVQPEGAESAGTPENDTERSW